MKHGGFTKSPKMRYTVKIHRLCPKRFPCNNAIVGIVGGLVGSSLYDTDVCGGGCDGISKQNGHSAWAR